MTQTAAPLLDHFWVIGINYKTVNTTDRGRFAVSPQQYEQFLAQINTLPQTEGFLLSTCNRTELIVFTNQIEMVVKTYAQLVQGSLNEFNQLATKYNGEEALRYLLRISGGLESQILGDYEIIGQMKHAFTQAKNSGAIHLLMERLFHTVLQSARSIRTNTTLSSGSISVAHTAANFVVNALKNKEDAKILVIGAGEIARNALLNLQQLVEPTQLTVSNRSIEKAQQLVANTTVNVLPFEICLDSLKEFDAVISAIQIDEPIIKKEHLLKDKAIILADLAIPYNIDPAVQSLPHVQYANVDIISTWHDATLEKRMKEVPKAEQIIEEHVVEFQEWITMRKHVPMIKSIKEKMQHFKQEYELHDDAPIDRAIKSMAQKIKERNIHHPGCNYIETFAAYVDQTTAQ